MSATSGAESASLALSSTSGPLPASFPFRTQAAVAESSILVVAFALAFASHSPGRFSAPILARSLAGAAAFQLCFYGYRLYRDYFVRRDLDFWLRLLAAFATASLALLLLAQRVPDAASLGLALPRFLPLAFASIVATRIAVASLAQAHEPDRVLILGSGPRAREIAEAVARAPRGDVELLGVLGRADALESAPLPWLGSLDELPAIVRQRPVSRVVVALDERRGVAPVDLLLECLQSGIKVEDGTCFLERLTGRIVVRGLRPSELLSAIGENGSSWQCWKDALEPAAAWVLLVLHSPLLLLIAGLVRLESPGPVVYAQERVGRWGRRFRMLKFRTMRLDAEAETGPVWVSDGPDPRATRIGRVLRRLHLDELPQLLNVARGEMSIVGPRPERPHFVELLTREVPYYQCRHSVKPGITGWAQVRYGYASSVAEAVEKLQFDLYYIRRSSLRFDLRVLLNTVRVVALGQGAR